MIKLTKEVDGKVLEGELTEEEFASIITGMRTSVIRSHSQAVHNAFEKIRQLRHTLKGPEDIVPYFVSFRWQTAEDSGWHGGSYEAKNKAEAIQKAKEGFPKGTKFSKEVARPN